MSLLLRRLKRKIQRLQEQTATLLQASQQTDISLQNIYRADPVGYIRDILHIDYLWDKQAEIINGLLQPPYRVLVKSGHNIGKTFLAACAINWWFDVFDPGIVMSTAPTSEHVRGVLWKEVRTLRKRAGLGGFIGESAPVMKTSESHVAYGLTARVGEAFQGRHDRNMLFVFDEATGVGADYWAGAASMFKPELGHAWLAICNPIDTTSAAYLEDCRIDQNGDPAWKTITLSALEHPNIDRNFHGESSLVPAAVSLQQTIEWLGEYGCEEIPESEFEQSQDDVDIEWPPGSGKLWRTSPEFQARALGCWPRQGTGGVWSDSLWQRILQAQPPIDPQAWPEIGADIARFGADWTSFHVRWGSVSVHHESHNGWDTVKSAHALIELANIWAGHLNAKLDKASAKVLVKQIPIKVDDDGVGGGVSDILRNEGHRVISVNAGTVATQQDFYPNKRSELWFNTAKKARKGEVCISQLAPRIRHRLKVQAMAPTWQMDGRGRRVVESKDDTKEKIKRSPDDMDALNLAYMDAMVLDIPQVFGQDRRQLDPQRLSHAGSKHLFGKRS